MPGMIWAARWTRVDAGGERVQRNTITSHSVFEGAVVLVNDAVDPMLLTQLTSKPVEIDWR